MPEISYGEAVRIAPRIRRVTAPNPGRMTGPGTNTYAMLKRLEADARRIKKSADTLKTLEAKLRKP